MTWGAEQALKAMIKYQVESLRFLARRTYCNLEFLRHLRHCADWQNMAHVQQSWFRECAADYGEELARLAGTGFQLARSDFAPLQGLMYRGARRQGPVRAPVDRPGPHCASETGPFNTKKVEDSIRRRCRGRREQWRRTIAVPRAAQADVNPYGSSSVVA